MKKYKTVEEFLNDQPKGKKIQIESLRRIILAANSRLVESIKWNAPNYAFAGEDRITFNVANKEGRVKLVFHMGALRKEDKKGAPIIEDAAQILEWVSDIRGYATFKSIKDIEERESALKSFIKRWLAIT
ncbi:MAG: DUF1801 domain-containing protein [Candidatus Pacebacteria bacterium]|nr:DUF1801 domain-containing protein [Candidatus Paceibacterota bacterium]